MIDLGLSETLSYVLTSEDDSKMFATNNSEKIKLLDPLSEDRNTLRQSVAVSLYRIYEYNKARNNKDVSIFEMGKVFEKIGEDYKETMNKNDKSRLDLLDGLVEYAVTEKIIEDLDSARDIFSSQIMDLVTPRPSEINHSFWADYKESPKQATDKFYKMSQQNNYIKTREIAQNIEYTYNDEKYGWLWVCGAGTTYK